MTHYPDPIVVPENVIEQRKKRLSQLSLSSLFGIAVRGLIILLELYGFFIFGSKALLMDAVASITDICSSILLVLFIKYAARPPDENHPFGHGRLEPLMGFQLGLMMGLIGGATLIYQLFFLSAHNQELIDPRAWVISLVAVLLLEISYQIVVRTARKRHSPALIADALHYRIDMVTSLMATAALIAAAFFPLISGLLDHIGGIFISCLMIGFGIYASRQNLNQVIDKVPEQKYFQLVRHAALRVDGVRETEKIRIQHSGPDAHVDIDVEVDPLLTVELAHRISQRVRVEIKKDWPEVQDVIVHIEPYYPNDH
jgi:cation diffusion facilitator family transporter